MFKAVIVALALLFAGRVGAQTDGAVQPEPAPEAQPTYRYALGLQYQFGPEAPGSARSEGKFSPVWALHWGRLRLSNGGGSALMGFGTMVYGPGASTELLQGKNWHLGASLRLDQGRDSDSNDNTRGLADVRRTVRGRFFASYSLNADLLLSGYLSQDLLGRGGGLESGLNLDWRLSHTPHSELTLGLGLGGADATYMHSYFGVTPAGALASGLRVYQPGAGLLNTYAGLAYTHAIDRHWIVYGSISESSLLGPAADSPLNQRSSAPALALRLAYRR